MLVLGRKQGEVIVIDGDIFLTVLSIEHGQVRLGFDAPQDVKIDRLEIHEKIQIEGDRRDD